MPSCRPLTSISRFASAFQIVLLSCVILFGCSEPPQTGDITLASGAMQPGVYPRACSDIDVTRGTLEAEILLKAQSEEITPQLSMVTTDIVVEQDTMFIIDPTDDRVIQLDPQANLVKEWGRRGGGPGEMKGGRAIALGPNRNVYTLDGSARINVFSPDGKVLGGLRAQHYNNAADMVVLPNGNIVLAKPVILPMEMAYVSIFEPKKGDLVRDVLATTPDRSNGQRPLMLGVNEVRLSAGPDGRFAAWYPADNFVDVFDSAGVNLARIEGCLPNEIRKFYADQFTGTNSSGSRTTLTWGVSFAGPDTIHVVSMYLRPEGGGPALRVRRYALDGTELSARDYDLQTRFNGRVNSVEFLNDSTFIAFHSETPEQGITRYRIR